MALVYFLCGLPTSGKTTFARELEADTGAIRFTLDERMLSRYDLTIFDDEYGQLAREEKERIWQEAQEHLKRGIDVILDWSLWSRSAREQWTARAQQSGHAYKLFHLDVPTEVLRERLRERNQKGQSGVHFIPLEEFDRFSHIFEKPTDDEQLNIQRISACS